MLNFYVNNLFWNKALNYITVRKNELWRFLPFRAISLKGIGDIPTKEQFRIRLSTILGPIENALENIDEVEKQTVLKWAPLTLNHKFDYLGSGLVEMDVIRWNCDFKTGFEWPQEYYLKQRKITKKGADIKVPWELSRCHHLLWLGEAYLFTKDDKFAKEVVAEIEHWLANNPLLYSVNWVCAMDVAIRAVNWIYALSMIIASNVVTSSFIIKVYKSLYQHGWYVFNNLEKSVPHSNNHLFSDYAGLVYLALLFQDTKYGKKWLSFVIPEYYEEIRRQVLPSGVQYERSISYHRLMTELVSYPSFVLKRNNQTIPVDIEYRIRSMYSFIATYTKENGMAPLIEDNDDGRFLPFVRRDFRHHDYLLNKNSLENRIVSNGVEMYPFVRNNSMMYYDAGHAVLRNGDAFLFVTNGGLSKYDSAIKFRGTHTHNDRLSFEFALGSDDVIIDPGAYVYTPDPARSIEFRATNKHNTVVVDDEEQNCLMPDNVFLQRKNSETTSFELITDTKCCGEYFTLDQHLTHQRCFNILNDELRIKDVLTKSGVDHNSVLSFHFSPQVVINTNNNGFAIRSSSYDIQMNFECGGSLEKQLIDDSYSPSYGVLEPSKTIRLSFSFNEKTTIETIIKWKKRN